jgi:hypothetical protein
MYGSRMRSGILLAGIAMSFGLLVGNPGCASAPPPPPAKVEVRPAAPGPKAVWVPGHWKWHGRRRGYDWVPGHWKVR